MARPSYSPWGRIERCRKKIDGVYEVSTGSHGGIMVAVDKAEELLSEAALNRGFTERGYVCFEEDCDAAIVIRELLDKDMWKVPQHFTDGQTAYEDIINATLVRWHPEYWCGRQRKCATSNL